MKSMDITDIKRIALIIRDINNGDIGVSVDYNKILASEIEKKFPNESDVIRELSKAEGLIKAIVYFLAEGISDKKIKDYAKKLNIEYNTFKELVSQFEAEVFLPFYRKNISSIDQFIFDKADTTFKNGIPEVLRYLLKTQNGLSRIPVVSVFRPDTTYYCRYIKESVLQNQYKSLQGTIYTQKDNSPIVNYVEFFSEIILSLSDNIEKNILYNRLKHSSTSKVSDFGLLYRESGGKIDNNVKNRLIVDRYSFLSDVVSNIGYSSYFSLHHKFHRYLEESYEDIDAVYLIFNNTLNNTYDIVIAKKENKLMGVFDISEDILFYYSFKKKNREQLINESPNMETNFYVANPLVYKTHAEQYFYNNVYTQEDITINYSKLFDDEYREDIDYIIGIEEFEAKKKNELLAYFQELQLNEDNQNVIFYYMKGER
jgi:hypothetical protein